MIWRNSKLMMWLTWIAVTAILGVYLGNRLTGDDKEIYLIGQTTDGHYQIELTCSACHKDSFGGTASLQEACMQCHGEELKTADDSHPKSKFTDPRNAERVKALDARLCITCHREHKPEMTRPMAVTMPEDFCIRCHEDVGRERETHRNLAFDSCASSGCHNFHDNRGLYEDFLVKHAHQPDNLQQQVSLRRNQAAWRASATGVTPVALGLQQHDGQAGKPYDSGLLQQWLDSAHARGAVNCSDCHARDNKGGIIAWVDRPSTGVCASCHSSEEKGFVAGKHGMRLAQGLAHMNPGMARLPMKPDVANREINCVSCHGPHSSDTREASVESCMGCHDDEHTINYQKSPHYRLREKASGNTGSEEAGVTCATCHMPRMNIKEEGIDKVVVQHNQNDNLKPNEKMLRSVCMNCHGLGFSIDALADRELVRANFSGKPARHIESIDWASSRTGKERQINGNSINPLRR